MWVSQNGYSVTETIYETPLTIQQWYIQLFFVSVVLGLPLLYLVIMVMGN